MKKMKILAWAVAVTILASSCNKYLEVVPDNTMKLENVFATKEEAYNALAKAYSYIPRDHMTHESTALLGDETVGRIDADMQNGTGNLRGERIMRGLQTTGSPLLGTWSGTGAGKQLYRAIRSCNVFLQYVDGVRHLSDDEKKDWRAQVTFLKAYYHFLLLRQYGPIIISDKVIDPDALSDDLFQKRSKVEEVFDYIIDQMDGVLEDLPEMRPEADLGMIDQVGAAAIKARILLYRASPIFSGNREFFDDFYDPSDGQKFFDVNATEEQTREKWGKALTAINEAIALAEGQGKKLFTSNPDKQYLMDTAFFRINPVNLRLLYDLRMIVTTPWNDELLWGNSNVTNTDQGEIADAMNIRLPAEQPEGIKELAGYSWQWLACTYQMAERYYTANGLPIDEDQTYNYNGRGDLCITPGAVDPEYPPLAGILQPNTSTVNLYMNREMRFYANLDITGGYVRTHYQTIPVLMMYSTAGGLKEQVQRTDYLCTGIGIQKMTHPESMSDHPYRVVRYPWPIIRLADLYLMKAEALNEYQATPDQGIWDAVNLIRRRAGIPDLEDVYNNSSIVKPASYGKHLTKQGMRDIILRERSIELAFEGHHFWDLWRHKRAHREFSAYIQGWHVRGSAASTFFVLEIVQPRKFIIRDYLWPIDLNELNTNGNLTQNPGW